MADGYSKRIRTTCTHELTIGARALMDIVKTNLERQGIEIGHPFEMELLNDGIIIRWTETEEVAGDA